MRLINPIRTFLKRKRKGAAETMEEHEGLLDCSCKNNDENVVKVV